MLDWGETLIFGGYALHALPVCTPLRSRACSIHRILPMPLSCLSQLHTPSCFSYSLVGIDNIHNKGGGRVWLGNFCHYSVWPPRVIFSFTVSGFACQTWQGSIITHENKVFLFLSKHEQNGFNDEQEM